MSPERDTGDLARGMRILVASLATFQAMHGRVRGVDICLRDHDLDSTLHIVLEYLASTAPKSERRRASSSAIV